MRIIFDNPPHKIRELCENYFDLSKVLPIWTYGEFIYNPHKQPINNLLLEHEKVHSKQQGESPAHWWTNYFENKDFRLSQEVEAYHRQYQIVKPLIKGRNELFNFLKAMAKELSSPMYGNMCSLQEAIGFIKNNVVK